MVERTQAVDSGLSTDEQMGTPLMLDRPSGQTNENSQKDRLAGLRDMSV